MGGKYKKPWALQTSVFVERAKENESCSAFDSDQVWIRYSMKDLIHSARRVCLLYSQCIKVVL